MTFINRMISEAKSPNPPREFVVPGNRVRQIAEHARVIMRYPVEVDELEKMIREGSAKLMGIPIRVAGQ